MVKKKIKAEDIDNYGKSSFQKLIGLQAVIDKPGMYIFNLGIQGYNQLFTEIFDNSVDEAMNGYSDEIIVRLNKDGSITVKDYGRGLPLDVDKETGKSTIEEIFTTLHMSGKFSGKNYKSAGGTHGVGTSVVLALSEWVDIKVCRDGYEYGIKLKYTTPQLNNNRDYEVVEKLHKIRKVASGITGTEVTFLPNQTIFKGIKFKDTLIKEKIKYTCYLENYLKVYFIDDRKTEEPTELKDNEIVGLYEKETIINDETGEKTEKDVLKENIEYFHFEGGLTQLVTDRNIYLRPITPIITLTGETNGIKYDIVLQWTDDDGENILSFVNNIRTNDGGTHETALKTSLTRSIQDYAKERNLNKIGKQVVPLEGNDIRDGLTCVINMKVPEIIPLNDAGEKYVEASEEERLTMGGHNDIARISFEGQTKGKLSTVEIRGLLEPYIYANLTSYFNSNSKEAEEIIEKTLNAYKARKASKKAREVVKGKKKESLRSKSKLAKALGKDKKKNELFIVEGDSAGGSAKEARNKNYQAVLPIRGKGLNVEDKTIEKVLDNAEYAIMIYELGCGILEEYDEKKLNYDKVIIMTDADIDGAHIQILLLTFFYRYMKNLILNGHLYIAQAPLYRIYRETGNSKDIFIYEGDNLEEIWEKELNSKKKGKLSLQRYKGLGEMNDEDLENTTMKIGQRKLKRIKINDDVETSRQFKLLMGNKTEGRRKLVEERSEFLD